MKEVRFWAGSLAFVLIMVCSFVFLLWCLYSGLTRSDDKAWSLLVTSVLFLPAFAAVSVHFCKWFKENT